MQVKRAVILEMASKIAQESVGNVTLIGNLRLLNNVGCLKEPQLRHLWAREADAEGLYYALEAPTFTGFAWNGGSHMVRGRYDLVIYEDRAAAEANEPTVLMEFKHGLSRKTIAQDLIKVLTENARDGARNATLMIVQEQIWRKTFDTFFLDLQETIRSAASAAGDRGARGDAWFELLVLVRNTPKRNTQPEGLYRALREDGASLAFADLWDPELQLKPQMVEAR